MEKKITEDRILGLLKNSKTKKEGVDVLIKIYQEPLYWHIRKLVISHDDSKDVLQEVFMRVWRNIDQFKGDSKLFTWLYRIAGNESLRFLERKRKDFDRQMSIRDMLETELETSDFISGEEIQMLLQKAILELTEKQRLVFNMRYFDEMEYADIAEIVESTVGSVKVLYHNAKIQIEKQIQI